MAEVAPDFRKDLRPEFGPPIPDHRQAIRRSLEAMFGPGPGALADLSVRPAVPEWSISVSHTTDLGGWVAVPGPATFGFDIEVRARVRDAVVRRVCTPGEAAFSDDFAALWSAKEALFKAAARGKTATLSQLRITEWEPDEDLVRFVGENGARGAVQSGPQFAAAWALAEPMPLLT